ncbi:MAG: family 20 glycosylhydrolase [Chitinophagaceae bacterium]|nr:family 20 glycosylhydrolase [Chitinophagaceae bacterium]
MSYMKKIIIASALLACSILSYAQSTPALIPQPEVVNLQTGSYALNAQSRIEATGGKEAFRIAELLAAQLRPVTGYGLPVANGLTKTIKANLISLELNNKEDAALGKEGYSLQVNNKGVFIKANQPAGLFYGIQTLLQLFPKEMAGKSLVKRTSWNLTAVSISDKPRFGWRGLMLDCSRHFWTKAEVKEFIDNMSKYKYNLLHWHLTDDQGWRIEIKSLPKLTEVGAWRVDKTGTFGTFSNPTPDEPKTYGGFYTQEDIKEVIQYAADRFVNILPEVDVPGHSSAAIASYPQLANFPEGVRVNSGEKLMNWMGGGKFTAIYDNSLNPAGEYTYEFLDKVFTEVAALFPFDYIHMGGDECAKNFWEKSDAVKELMQKENLKDMHEVQSYFVKRVSKIISAKGKKTIGWDEILEGGLASNAAVMSWRGVKGGLEAIKQGHEVVMSPNTNAYIDFMQGDASIEPPVYSSLRLKTAYEFEPVPADADPKLVKGGQANLWCEQIYNTRHMQYMVWPRAFAISESLWSPKEKKNWNNFVSRTEAHFGRLDEAQIKYAPSMYDPIIKPAYDTTSKELKVDLSTEVEGLDIYYSWDNSFPDRYYPKYTQTLVAPKDASTLKLITYRGKQVTGRMMVIPVADLQKRGTKK